MDPEPSWNSARSDKFQGASRARSQPSPRPDSTMCAGKGTSVGMRFLGKYPVSNISNIALIAAFVAWLAEQTAGNWVSHVLGERAVEMPWGWITLVLLAFCLGIQAKRFDDRVSPIQEWARRRAMFVRSLDCRKQNTSAGFAYFIDLEFLQDARNIVISVDVYRSENSFTNPWSWRRWRHVTPLKREDCNRGGKESLKLIELRPQLDPPKLPNAFQPNQLTGWKTVEDCRRNEGGRFRVRLSVDAAGRKPFIAEWLFLWREKELYPMPLEVPSYEGNDSSEFKEEECVLWAIK